MDTGQIISLIGSVGFPIVAWFYMAIEFNKSIKENTKATNDTSQVMRSLHRRLDKLDDEERKIAS